MYVNKQIRLANWDYRSSAAYFITICTQDRTHYFGKITDGKMNLSQLGILADVFWHEIKNHAKDIELGEFVVMPDHIHGILILKDSSSPVA
jgi:REP element-mobilizing transposase RayT